MPSKTKTKARRVILAKTPAIIVPPSPVTLSELLRDVKLAAPLPPRIVIEPADGIYLPKPADIDQYGRADHQAYIAAHLAQYVDDPAVNIDDIPTLAERLASEPEPSVENIEPEPVSSATIAASEPASLNDRATAKAVAARAVAAFYAGASLPFKSAYELKRKSPINFALTRAPTARSAALLAAILTYCDVQPGTLQFVRGSGSVPGSLLGYTGDEATRLHPAGPESGGLSNLIPDRVAYVSGALAGPGCENAVFRINYASARANLLAHNDKQPDGEHLFGAPLALLDLLHDAG